MKKTTFRLFKFFMVTITGLAFASCNFGNENPDPSLSGDDTNTGTVSEYTGNESTRNIATDDASTIAFTNKVYINLTDLSFSADNSSWTSLSSEAQTVLKDSSQAKITALYNSDENEILISSAKSSESVQVVVTGSAAKVHVYIENKKDVTTGVLLSNATIESTGYYPAINFDKKAKVYLQVEGLNSITDGRIYGYGYGYPDSNSDSTNPVTGGLDTKATVYSKGPLLLCGTGSLTLTEGYKHGIYSKDYIRVFGGNWTINSSGRNGIQSVNGFIMDDGSITIKGTGTNTNNQSRGIIVEGEESTTYAGEGYILINGGSLNIETVSKAISAKWDITEDAETTETTDDPYPYVKITGGNITIKTTGTPADESKNSYTFTDADGVSVTEKTKLSPEGIEGKVAVFIEGGTLDLQTTDDCINASRSGYAALKISGGSIYAYSSGNDALDSNGTLTITGGTIVALTATTPECAFDCDNYTFSITGGTFIGIGTNNYSKPTASASTQSTIVLSGNYLGTAGKTFVIGESTSSPVFAYTIDSSIYTSLSSNYIAVISSPEITKGTEYSIFTDAAVSGGSTFNGLYTTLPSVTSGTSKASGIKTTDSSIVYTLSSSTNNGAQEGEHGNPQDGTQTGPGGRR